MPAPAETRQRLVAAAEEVLQREGVVGLTTKSVARVAGRSEGSIYNHFADRLELILAVIDARLPEFIAVLAGLVPGRRTVAENLERVARSGIAFERSMLPLVGGLAADPVLLARFKEVMLPADKGPHRLHRGITAYLQGEKALGRLGAETDCAALALLLIGGWREAVFQELFGRPPIASRDAPRRIVRSLLPKETS
ncbi:MAG TPA: TetR/AcrR family transcriptional regulator [Acidimicrobiales bacterium]|nr:TetR/AcrR family transcriptional regulator [Acidimicrobiales bacterium]